MLELLPHLGRAGGAARFQGCEPHTLRSCWRRTRNPSSLHAFSRARYRTVLVQRTVTVGAVTSESMIFVHTHHDDHSFFPARSIGQPKFSRQVGPDRYIVSMHVVVCTRERKKMQVGENENNRQSQTLTAQSNS